MTSPGSILEMEEKVLHGRRVRVWKHLPPTFRQFLLHTLHTYSDRQFLSSPLPAPRRRHPSSQGGSSSAQTDDSRENVTFGQVLEKSLRLAAWMRKRGLGVGSKVMIGGRNCTGFIVAFVATHLIGGVTVFLNAWLPREQLIWSIRMTNPSLVLLDEERAEILGPYQYVRETDLPDMFCWSGSSYLPTLLDVFDTPVDVNPILRGDGLEDLGPEGDAVIFFSSGTSGFPKAVLSTQRMALSNLWSGMVAPARAALRAGLPIPPLPKPTDPQRTLLLAIPLFHVTGCLSWLMRAFFAGSRVIMMRRWNTEEAIRLIVKENVRVIGGVPAVVSSILQSPSLPKDQTFDTVFYGGAPPSSHMPKEVKSKWPKGGLVQGYGLTETNAYVCSIAGPDYLDRVMLRGPPVPICDLKIVDPTTRQRLPTGQVGLLLVNGPQVMKCYLGDEVATARAIDEDGWLDTGDIGCVDEEGFLYIKDRLKDVIIRGGENITSSEVENALYALPYIAEASAVPLPHDRLGEVVGAVITLRPSQNHTRQIEERKIISDIKARGTLARYAVPEMVMIHEGPLPKNVNGKILKKDLKLIIQKQWEKRKLERSEFRSGASRSGEIAVRAKL
uniref:Long-chain fatty acid CoA ligase n=1 Tax=Kwoniella bestiolae CBS 10118 TaxID=1296100 RepID=A0A1B9FTW3_9TREE|nr:long-chain fatty acid CoA ligase [Kwoniella bestiolae CBS 10118]OCF22202.1 long-chain fatty acid CoA ligase [Kwoniella bestiolae CBS 10118]